MKLPCERLSVEILKSQILKLFGGNVQYTSQNTIKLILNEKILKFKFKNFENTKLKNLTICYIDNQQYEGILYHSNFFGGDIVDYNEEFLNIVKGFLNLIEEEGFDYFYSFSVTKNPSKTIYHQL